LPGDQQAIFLSRALAAYALTSLLDISADDGAAAVTDGYGDNGIDAVYFDKAELNLYVVQSKWIGNGKGSPAGTDVQKFVNGVADLLNQQIDRFNDKVKKHSSLLQSALDDPNARLVLIIIHTGQQDLGKPAMTRLDDLLKNVNEPTPLVSLRVLKQGDIHNFVSQQAGGALIELDVTLHDWGIITDPFVAYYGQISAGDIADWWNKHGPRLFSKNLRHLIAVSEVNEGMTSTLLSQPEHFWYFNNGITVVCSRVQKKPITGTARKVGQFHCEGVSVVNGAQTVGSIGGAASKDAGSVAKAWVPARFISLEDGASTFASSVTRATNTQNRIERRDFVALDPNQERLRAELALDGKVYAIKTGEPEPPSGSGCSVLEATIALACAKSDPSLSVQAKREIGRLWQDISQPPYTDLFNPSLRAVRLWRCVEVMRVVDAELRKFQDSHEGRERAMAVHGNRLLLHLVMRQLPVDRFDDPALDMKAVIRRGREVTEPLIKELINQVDRLFARSYPASLFKNASKCADLVKRVKVPSSLTAGT